MEKKIFLNATAFLLTLSIWFPPVSAQDTIPDDFCISAEEMRLVQLINDYRKAMTLDPIPLSKALCFVAKTHALDLQIHQPDSNTCNFHSWSNKGHWSACCFEKDIKDKSCMTGKPAEITAYKGEAYEMVYWENKQANADKAFNQWRETSASRSILTNFKEWQDYSWSAIGVSIYKGFAIVWLGEEPDARDQVKECGSNIVFKVEQPKPTENNRTINSATGRFYVIVGSFKSLADAKDQLTTFITEGHKKAKIVIKEDKYRISLSDYPSMEMATKAKEALPQKYKGAWVLEY